MSKTLITLASASAAFFLSGCGDKSEAEKAELERDTVRIEKAQTAAKYYRVLAEKFSDHEHAAEAAGKAKALEVQGAPKK